MMNHDKEVSATQDRQLARLPAAQNGMSQIIRSMNQKHLFGCD
jgi:hypothetical protein